MTPSSLASLIFKAVLAEDKDCDGNGDGGANDVTCCRQNAATTEIENLTIFLSNEVVDEVQ